MLTFKVLSALLVYPVQEIIDSLDEMAAVVEREKLVPAAARSGLSTFMATLKGTDLLEAQAQYISLFDQSRSLSLHLFEHIHGESLDRGQAMVDLLDPYRAHGLALPPLALPDYLPLLHRQTFVLGQGFSLRLVP